MRFRPANISLINRRHYLPRLLLILSSKYNHKNNPSDLQLLTGSHHINFCVARHPAVICKGSIHEETILHQLMLAEEQFQLSGLDRQADRADSLEEKCSPNE